MDLRAVRPSMDGGLSMDIHGWPQSDPIITILPSLLARVFSYTLYGAGGLKPESRYRSARIFSIVKACTRPIQWFGRNGCQGPNSLVVRARRY